MIPCIINNFNRLSTTSKLCSDLISLGYSDITILDNNSTYEPLLEWYSDCPYKIIDLKENIGSLALYRKDVIDQFRGNEFIAYTDSDIELNPNTPDNFIQILLDAANKYKFAKVGLAIQIDDLPSNPYTDHYKEWEAQNWAKKLSEDIYIADIDTTFAIIKPFLPFAYRAIRIAGNLTSRHIPYYLTPDILSEEEQYYMDHASELSTLKRFYKSMSLIIK